MGLVFHFVEIAVLLAVAYAAGWGIGFGLHWLLGQPQPVAVIPPERLAAATGVAPAGETPPVVASVGAAGASAAPPPPADPPLEISPEALAALETPAGAASSVTHMASLTPAGAAASSGVAAPSVIAKPAEPAPATVGPPLLQPASRPGRAWSGERKGREAVQFEPPVVEPATAAPPTPVVEDVRPEPAPVVETPPAAPIIPPKPLRDDAEAMRSIEAIGNPSIVAPVADARAAVNAAQAAVEQMLARSIINPPKPEGDIHAAQGKPVGLPRPRDGVRDDLRRIAGIGGGLYAHYQIVVSYEGFGIERSILFLAMVIIGGTGSIMGTLMGTAFVILLPEAMEWLTVALSGGGIDHALGLKTNITFLREIAIGVIIILFLVFEPDGLAHRWRQIKAYWKLYPFSH